MIVVDTMFYNTKDEKESIIEQIKATYKYVKLRLGDDFIVYQYNDGKKDK